MHRVHNGHQVGKAHGVAKPRLMDSPLPDSLAPMLATTGSLPQEDGEWAFEFKWDGIRVLLWIDDGRPRALSRGGHDLTVAFPELAALATALGAERALLDGELVALDEAGRARFSRLQHRIHVSSEKAAALAATRDPASMIVFDLLHLDGRSLIGSTYDERRAALAALDLAGPNWGLTPSFTDELGPDVLRASVELGFEGVVAKRRSSVYRPGVRSREWIKVKHERTQEVVIGGWTDGQGDRASTFGALLLGLPTAGDGEVLTYVGKVGTGFTLPGRRELLGLLGPSICSCSPFAETLPPALRRTSHWVHPEQVGEVRFGEWTPAGHLRHPVWRGLRVDKSVGEVRREPA